MTRYDAVNYISHGIAKRPGMSEARPVRGAEEDTDTKTGDDSKKKGDALEAYFPLSVNFLTQENQAYCGVASIVMVLNALELSAPAAPEYDGFHTFTQDNFLDARTEAILPRAVLMHQGMTLDQIGSLLDPALAQA